MSIRRDNEPLEEFLERDNVKYEHALINERRINKKLSDQISSLKSENERLRSSLAKYADKSKWRTIVIDEDSGAVETFDWDNDSPHDYDYGWEIAQEALSGGWER